MTCTRCVMLEAERDEARMEVNRLNREREDYREKRANQVENLRAKHARMVEAARVAADALFAARNMFSAIHASEPRQDVQRAMDRTWADEKQLRAALAALEGEK